MLLVAPEFGIKIYAKSHGMEYSQAAPPSLLERQLFTSLDPPKGGQFAFLPPLLAPLPALTMHKCTYIVCNQAA